MSPGAAEYLEEVEWPTLVSFTGLFIMVGALVEVGVIESLGEALTEAVGDRYLGAGTILIWGSGLMSGIVDNIPYVATMSPLVSDLVVSGGNSARPSHCGGRWPSAPTSAATRPRSGRAPTSSCLAWLPAMVIPSHSGSSPSTDSSWPRSRSRSAGSTTRFATSRSRNGHGWSHSSVIESRTRPTAGVHRAPDDCGHCLYYIDASVTTAEKISPTQGAHSKPPKRRAITTAATA